MISDLAVTPVSETLIRLSAERKSGDLEVRSGTITKTVYFDHGRIVFAASNLRRDRLGESLVALGSITDEEFERASTLMRRERTRRFGEALVRAGVMDTSELGRSVARQVSRIVISLFRLGEGVASFEERRCTIPLEYMVSLSLHRLLYEGIRTMRRPELVHTGLGDLDRRVALASVPPFRFDLSACGEEEREVLEQAQRPVTLRRLAWAEHGLDFDRMRLVYALFASGILVPESAAGAGERAPFIQMETGTFLLSALRRGPEPSTPEALRREIKDELRRSARLDHNQVVVDARKVSTDELRRALADKMERYHVLLEAVREDEELRTDVEIILGRTASLLRRLHRAAGAAGPSAVLADTVPPRAPARPDTPAPLSTIEAPPAEVQRLVREGDIRMAVGDHASAVRVFEQLVEARPALAAYRLRLAAAMAAHPPTALRAEREYLEAVRLQPDSAEAHYELGLYYKAMRQKARALAEMQTAVRLSPEHRGARRELEALAPGDDALSDLKKRVR